MTEELLGMADLLCKTYCLSGVQPCTVLGGPCGHLTPGPPLDNTGTRDCTGVPDKAVSPGRPYDHNLIKRHTITISD